MAPLLVLSLICAATALATAVAVKVGQGH